MRACVTAMSSGVLQAATWRVRRAHRASPRAAGTHAATTSVIDVEASFVTSASVVAAWINAVNSGGGGSAGDTSTGGGGGAGTAGLVVFYYTPAADTLFAQAIM